MFLLITLGIVALTAVLYYLSKRNYNYWAEKNVPHIKPVPFFGNFSDLFLFKDNTGSTEQRICRQFPDEPLVGAYIGTKPALIVQDPELIKLVTTKDFYYFSGRENSDHTHKEWVTKNLFNAHGDQWKVLRQNLTPLFSSAKMKNMFFLIENYSKEFDSLLEKEIKISKKQEIRDLFGRFTMDCIGSCAFGLDPKAMGEDEKNPFRRMGRMLFEPSYIMLCLVLFRTIWPAVFYGLGLKSFPPPVTNFFNKLLVGVFEKREFKQTTKNDFVDLILGFADKKYIEGDRIANLKGDSKEKVKIEVNNELLVAQCLVFFAAGFETSATTASFTLYELAKHPDVQERARAEVLDWLKRRNGQLVYECVTELPFLEQCIDEALRLYPVLGVITREVTETYRFPNGPTVERGLRIHLPAFHIHRNPKYFPDPDVFRPERFAPENKHNIRPYTYFPFGEGPRICIGMRFAKMQVLAGLVTILKKYRVELAEGMPSTLEFEPKSIVTASKHGILLNLIPLES